MPTGSTPASSPQTVMSSAGIETAYADIKTLTGDRQNKARFLGPTRHFRTPDNLRSVNCASLPPSAGNVGGAWPIAANLTGITADIYGLAFSPDSGTLYAIDSDGNLTSYVGTVAPTTMTVLNAALVPFVLAASTTESDGSYWLGIGYNDGDASLLNVVGGVLGPEFPFTVSPNLSGAYTMGFSKDGTMVEVGTDDSSFGIWSVPLPTPANPRTPPIGIVTDFVYGAAFHPSGTTVAIGAGSADTNRQLGIWTIATGAVLSTVSNTTLSHRPTAVAFSPDGTTLVAGEHACGKFIVCAD